VCESGADLDEVQKIILPGVGAFKDFMCKIKLKNIEKKIIEKSNKNIPILGVCLGFQILFQRSTEHGDSFGLGILKGSIDSFKSLNYKIKVPHVGWNSCTLLKKNYLFDDIKNESDFYFTHSYYLKELNEREAITKTEYENFNFISAVSANKIYGVQFHPEKSQNNGLKLLKNFYEKC
jgi:glutamine amidotransferase